MHLYMYRHQAGGILTDFAFTAKPTDEQLAPLRARMALLHGEVHRKTGEPYWDLVVDVPSFGPGEVPAYAAESSEDVGNAASMSKFGISGSGTVTPPG